MSSSNVVRYRGKIYRRYPDSDRWNDRVYFKTNGFEGTPRYLHRTVYEDCFGPIPDGHDVHHKDGNPLNNKIDNLELIPEFDHGSEHAKKRYLDPAKKAKNEEHLANIRPEAAKWHGSEEGQSWHSERGIANWAMRTPIKKTCDQCGEEFDCMSHRHKDRFCSNNCKSAWRRKSGLDDISKQCVICGGDFIVNKYEKTKTCSESCARRLSRETKRKKTSI